MGTSHRRVSYQVCTLLLPSFTTGGSERPGHRWEIRGSQRKGVWPSEKETGWDLTPGRRDPPSPVLVLLLRHSTRALYFWRQPSHGTPHPIFLGHRFPRRSEVARDTLMCTQTPAGLGSAMPTSQDFFILGRRRPRNVRLGRAGMCQGPTPAARSCSVSGMSAKLPDGARFSCTSPRAELSDGLLGVSISGTSLLAPSSPKERWQRPAPAWLPQARSRLPEAPRWQERRPAGARAWPFCHLLGHQLRQWLYVPSSRSPDCSPCPSYPLLSGCGHSINIEPLKGSVPLAWLRQLVMVAVLGFHEYPPSWGYLPLPHHAGQETEASSGVGLFQSYPPRLWGWDALGTSSWGSCPRH